jgi:putative ABC transport system ATP-binding protein
MLERVGLSEKMRNLPNQLSGGQQQRVAIARALVTQPTILLADEPTGALDQKTGAQVMNLFQELNTDGRTIVMITHDINIARHAKRIVNILDGYLTEQEAQQDAT